MIIFFANGRLGNQIFQFAFLSTIAKDREKVITFFMDELLEVFEVSNKNFVNITIKNKFLKYLIRKMIPLLSKLASLLSDIRIISFIEQKRDNINKFPLPEIKIKKGVIPIKFVHSDFFQSEKLFNKHILNTLKIKDEYVKKAESILEEIPKYYSKVFIHVRRGDYLKEIFYNEKGINLPKKYYLKAIEIISKEVNNPYFIFLSDDPDYVRDCFEDIKPKYISNNPVGVDFALMTLCEYGVCSNSTFSWWGAYLSKNRKKIIAPKYWYGWKKKIEYPVGIHPTFAILLEVD